MVGEKVTSGADYTEDAGAEGSNTIGWTRLHEHTEPWVLAAASNVGVVLLSPVNRAELTRLHAPASARSGKELSVINPIRQTRPMRIE